MITAYHVRHANGTTVDMMRVEHDESAEAVRSRAVEMAREQGVQVFECREDGKQYPVFPANA